MKFFRGSFVGFFNDVLDIWFNFKCLVVLLEVVFFDILLGEEMDLLISL